MAELSARRLPPARFLPNNPEAVRNGAQTVLLAAATRLLCKTPFPQACAPAVPSSLFARIALPAEAEALARMVSRARK